MTDTRAALRRLSVLGPTFDAYTLQWADLAAPEEIEAAVAEGHLEIGDVVRFVAPGLWSELAHELDTDPADEAWHACEEAAVVARATGDAALLADAATVIRGGGVAKLNLRSVPAPALPGSAEHAWRTPSLHGPCSCGPS